MTLIQWKAASPPSLATPTGVTLPPFSTPPSPPVSVPAAKQAIRTSLTASTVDGVFAAIFSNITGGVLLSNFLVELQASPMEIGLLASIPLMANLLQPLGAYWGDRSTSRHQYCLWVYGTSRMLWLILALGIGCIDLGYLSPRGLIPLTLIVVLATHVLGAMGSASWLSWMATLVPSRLRGRYFGTRNSSASLTSLLCVPLAGVVVSQWWGGPIGGYGLVLVIGILCGLASLGFQYRMVDVNPQVQNQGQERSHPTLALLRCLRSDLIPTAAVEPLVAEERSPVPAWNLAQHKNFWLFLLYFSLWMFAVNLSAPFFNLYLLDTLELDVSRVTLYATLFSAAHLVMLVLWGKLADRFGNRTLLLTVGLLVAATPLLWLGVGADALSVWVGLPLLHLLMGGTWSAIDLCTNNLQLGVAPARHQSVYFAIAAAVAGVCGALGTTLGGLLATWPGFGGLLSLFVLSSVVRLVALVPLMVVQESQRGAIANPVLSPS